MGYYRIYAVILIPADRLAAANAYLDRQGMGGDVFKKALIRIADPDEHEARGYAGLVRVDVAGWATLQRVIEGQANCYLFGGFNKQSAAADALVFIDSKGFRVKPVT